MNIQPTQNPSSQPTMDDSGLNLSAESHFYVDWKHQYHQDTEETICNPLPPGPVMTSATRLVANLCARFRLSHSIEFSTIDTLIQFLRITAVDSAVDLKFLQQIPLYVVTVLSVVTKYIDARIQLDRRSLQQMLQQFNPELVSSTQRLTELEFDVLKALNYKVNHSLLLGAVERFSKDYILTRGVARKKHIGELGIKVLRVVYAQQQAIYDSLQSNVKSQEMFTRFRSNKLILAAAIVLVILRLCGVDDKPTLDHVVTSLSNECFVDPTNLTSLRDAILNVFN